MIDPEVVWYVIGVAALAIPVHGLIRRPEVACPLAAALAALIGCGLLIATEPDFKPGWAVPVAGVAFVVALPISFAVGMAVEAIRSLRDLGWAGRSADMGPGGVRPVVSPDILPEQVPRP